jgi:hypothetical protein
MSSPGNNIELFQGLDKALKIEKRGLLTGCFIICIQNKYACFRTPLSAFYAFHGSYQSASNAF